MSAHQNETPLGINSKVYNFNLLVFIEPCDMVNITEKFSFARPIKQIFGEEASLYLCMSKLYTDVICRTGLIRYVDYLYKSFDLDSYLEYSTYKIV